MNSPKKRVFTAFFAGGCFWNVEKELSRVIGVKNTQVGYMKGSIYKPEWGIDDTGKSVKVETVKVDFYPQSKYPIILERFFKIHNPRSLDHQGNDKGSQYRGVVFYNSPKQKRDYELFIKKKKINTSSLRTVLLKANTFKIAEDFHQKYSFQKPCKNRKTENSGVFDRICKNNTQKAEPPKSGKYYTKGYRVGKMVGKYNCSCCGSPLYSSKDTYESGSGWPSFKEPIKRSFILLNERTNEIRCTQCGLHLGHRISETQKTLMYDCINSVCLNFVPNKSLRIKGGSTQRKRQFKSTISNDKYKELIKKKRMKKNLTKREKKQLKDTLFYKYCKCNLDFERKNENGYGICMHSIYKRRGFKSPSLKRGSRCKDIFKK
tara:strand:- start:5443 stop:6570 length:1128 start_codon:yes stop_codon:yes gene_type:complete